MSDFFEAYEKLCQKKGISTTKAGEEAGFNRATVSGWRHGVYPRYPAVLTLSRYFGVTPNTFAPQYSDVDPSTLPEALRDDEKELLQMYNAFSEGERKALRNMLCAFASREIG